MYYDRVPSSRTGTLFDEAHTKEKGGWACMTVSYPVYFTSDVPNYKQMCQDTVAVYTQAVRYLADVIAKEWANIGGCKDNTCTAAVEVGFILSNLFVVQSNFIRLCNYLILNDSPIQAVLRSKTACFRTQKGPFQLAKRSLLHCHLIGIIFV